jgi:hypothetical protein
VRNGCHPFSTKDFFENNYVIVHNGVISNDDELVKMQKELGIDYISGAKADDGSLAWFNDSEAFAYDLAGYLEGENTKLTAAGTIAFIDIKNDKDGKPVCVYFGRNNGNPLHMMFTDKELTLSSEGPGESIEAHQLYCYDYATGKLTTQPFNIPSFATGSYDYTGYASGYQRSGGYYEDDDDELSNTYFSTQAEVQSDTILYEAGYNYKDAISIAEYKIEQLKQRIAFIDEVTFDPQDEQADKLVESYLELHSQVEVLEEALDILKEENSGIKPLGFHYTPDHETASTKTNTHIGALPATIVKEPTLSGFKNSQPTK